MYSISLPEIEFVRDLLLVLGGISLSIGMLSLIVGIYIKSSRIYFYFGVFSIGAGLYYLIYTRYLPGEIQNLIRFYISAAAVYYIFFPLFIAEFTRSRHKTFAVILSLTILAGYVVFLFTDLQSDSLTWQVIVHAGSMGIGAYGIYNGWKMIRSSRVSGIVFTASMIIFLLFLIDEIFATYLGFALIARIGGFLPPLDFYPMLFIVIMTGVLLQDLAMKYHLQKQVTQKDKKWSTLMDNVGLIVIELNPEGKVEYVNSHFETMTGYNRKEVLGKNWFDLMIAEEERKKLASVFREDLKKDIWSEYQNCIIVKNGNSLIINWSNLPPRDEEAKVIVVLSIGFDQTRQQEQMNEIIELKKQLEKENLMLQSEITRRSGGLKIIGDSTSIKYAINKAIQVAPMDSTVLLEGETGVGKELFADLIHAKRLRQDNPFLKINCAAIPRELIESELFGHKKGSFTGAISNKKGQFELADKGTLFLDEISAMPLELQSKLLRVLQNGEFHPVGAEESIHVNVRIIAATNENLKTQSEQGNFRNDLFYRLNVYPITIPPLRQRTEDIPQLISHFTKIIGQRLNKEVGKVSKSDLEKLMDYHWPGNVRELENWVERAIIGSQGDKLEFAFEQSQESPPTGEGRSMEDIQRQLILKTLEECNWKINGADGAASRLKMHPSTLRSKMKKLAISRPA